MHSCNLTLCQLFMLKASQRERGRDREKEREIEREREREREQIGADIDTRLTISYR